MDHLLNVFTLKRSNLKRADDKKNLSCGDIPDLCESELKMKTLKKGNAEAFDIKHVTPLSSVLDRVKSMSNSQLVINVDDQLIQIREKLAMFREQDNQFRERIKFLSDSVGELASRSSHTPSECSHFGSSDESSKEDVLEEIDHQTLPFSDKPKLLHTDIPTVKVTGCRDHFISPVAADSFCMRRATSDPAIHSHLSEGAGTLEKRRYGMYSSDETINVYPNYDHPETIHTLL